MYSSGPRKRTFLGDLKLRGTVHHSQPIKDTADTDPPRPAPNADLVLPALSTTNSLYLTNSQRDLVSCPFPRMHHLGGRAHLKNGSSSKFDPKIPLENILTCVWRASRFS